jgi:L-ribulose-5-phosphate 3-epimerase
MNIFKLIKNSEKIGSKYFVIPLVDNSSLKNKKQEIEIIEFVKKILTKFKKVNILFESDYEPKKLLNFIKKFKSKRVGINYDSGNSANMGYDFKDEKIYFEYVKNFHIKDRKLHGKTVRLGKGDANLKKILIHMKKIKYKKNFILQTARNEQNEHLKEISINRNYLLNLNL